MNAAILQPRLELPKLSRRASRRQSRAARLDKTFDTWRDAMRLPNADGAPLPHPGDRLVLNELYDDSEIL